MRPEIWIGTVEISFSDATGPNNLKRAFTVVTTWASSLEEFKQKCVEMLESHGWKLIGVEVANPVPSGGSFSEEVEDMVERTRMNKAAVIYGTFHTYPVM